MRIHWQVEDAAAATRLVHRMGVDQWDWPPGRRSSPVVRQSRLASGRRRPPNFGNLGLGEGVVECGGHQHRLAETPLAFQRKSFAGEAQIAREFLPQGIGAPASIRHPAAGLHIGVIDQCRNAAPSGEEGDQRIDRGVHARVQHQRLAHSVFDAGTRVRGDLLLVPDDPHRAGFLRNASDPIGLRSGGRARRGAAAKPPDRAPPRRRTARGEPVAPVVLVTIGRVRRRGWPLALRPSLPKPNRSRSTR